MIKDTAVYDEKCVACHALSTATPARADQPGKMCPVAQRDCAHCHMPRQATADGVFTDHRIRVVRVGEPYPE
jgi:predicted CXXCH cytochrome family protein